MSFIDKETIDFFIQTDMGDDVLKRCVQCSRDLAMQAVVQHRSGIEFAVEKIEFLLDALGARMEAATGNPWSVGIAPVEAKESDIGIHFVFATERLSEEQLGDRQFLIEVRTIQECSEIRPGFFKIVFRTTVRTEVPEEERPEDVDPDDELINVMISDIMQPLEIVEFVGG